MKKINLLTKEIDENYENYLREEVLNILVARCENKINDKTNDFNLLKKLKEKSLRKAFQPKLETLYNLYEKAEKDPLISDDIKKKYSDEINQINNYIETTYLRTKKYEVNEYFNNSDYLDTADNKYLNNLKDNIKSKCPLPIDFKDINEANEIYIKNRNKLQKAYNIKDDEMVFLDIFLYQCKSKLYNCFKSYPILLSLYGKQGTGKTTLANILYKVLNNEKRALTSSIDDILGNFGSLNVGTKVVMKFDEFGKSNKENLDNLKSYIDGGIKTINRKYRDPIDVDIISSFILTTNQDPTFLYGTEKNSRRICIINMNQTTFNDTEENIHKYIENMWANLNNSDDETNILKVLNININKIILDKVDNDINENFQDWLSTLNVEQIETIKNMSTYKKWTATAFKKYFDPNMSITTFKIFLNQERYFEKHTSDRITYYTTNQELIDLINDLGL